MAKSNAVRLLNETKVAYALREYDVDPNDLSAESVAAKIRLPPEQVFKTPVVSLAPSIRAYAKVGKPFRWPCSDPSRRIID